MPRVHEGSRVYGLWIWGSAGLSLGFIGFRGRGPLQSMENHMDSHMEYEMEKGITKGSLGRKVRVTLHEGVLEPFVTPETTKHSDNISPKSRALNPLVDLGKR